MKSFLSITGLIFISFGVFGQTTDSTKYLLPGGKIVAADKLDSVIKSWDHRPFSMKHDEKRPGLVELILMTDEMKQQFAADRQKANVMLNRPAPDFNLKGIDGQEHRLSDLKGKVVVLNFWFTSCAPCIAEMPELNSVKNNAGFTKVAFLGLALDNAAAVRNFLSSHAFDYILLADAKAVHEAYKVGSCPTSMVIGKDGTVRFVQSSGDKIAENLSAAISAAL